MPLFNGTPQNDTLIGGAGADTLVGGLGNDTYVVGDIGDVVTESPGEGNDTVKTTLNSYSLAGTNVENLTYTGAGNFTGTGNSDSNTLTSSAGNDVLDGGVGADRLVGGAGNETYYVDNAGDMVVEATSAGTDTVNTTLASYTLALNVEVLTFTGVGNFAGTGNAIANTITGGSGDDTLDGGLGADTVSGGDGNDTYIVDNAGDVVSETGTGTDTIKTKLAIYSLGSNLESLIYAGSGSFSGAGNALDNIITGGTGNDTLTGGAGVDTLTGGLGNDTYVVDDIGDVVAENPGEGNDTVKTTLSSYNLAGTNVENLTYAGAGNFTGAGNSDSNTLTGSAGNDVLDGGVGADRLVGGTGNDTYYVDNAGDVVVEATSAGTDTVNTTLASYTLALNVEVLTFTGVGNFAGTGNAIANAITGGSGDDTLDGGLGADTVSGGDGNDTYIIDNAGDVVSETGTGTDTIKTKLAIYTLGSNLECLIYAGGGSFSGAGNALDNIITGGTGNDTLTGGAGADTLTGGLGNDTYVVDDIGDVVAENPGEGNDTVKTTFNSYNLAGTNVENLTYAGAGNFTGAGNSDSNTLTGSAGNDVLDGGIGADRLVGGVGNDTYYVDNAGDVVVEATSAGTDTVNATLASYTLALNVEVLNFTGVGNFAGTGNAIANTITGGSGDDTLDGGLGADTVSGGDGNDTYIVDNAGDMVSESGAGVDTIKTKLAIYTLGSNLENLIYAGGGSFIGAGNALDNVITGGTGNDTLTGGAGADTLTGGLGNDLLSGGDGNDTYIIDNAGDVVSETGTGTDTVKTVLAVYTLGSNLENLIYTGAAGFAGTGNALDNAISGGIGNDTLNGGSANDTLEGGAGDDVIDGGNNTDTAIFTHDWIHYTITGAGPFTIADNSGGAPDGTDTVSNVENFQFANGTFSATVIANDAPTDIVLSAASVSENAANGTVVGSLSSLDSNSGLGDTASYSLLVDAGGRFGISGTDLVVANGSLLDYETNASHAVTVRITDGHGAYYDEEFTIAVSDLNDNAPVFDSGTSASIAENVSTATVVYDADAHDDDGTPANNAIAYSLSAGGDNDLFSIDSVTGQVRFRTSPNYESPGDAGSDNVYDVVVHANDGLNDTHQAVAITVTDSVEVFIGTSGDDSIVGQSGADSIRGLEGNDTLIGGGGNDTIKADDGDDSVSGDFGNDSIWGDNQRDTLHGGEGNDTILGDGTINGGSADRIYGDEGDDSLLGGHDNDTIDGGDGNDTIRGDGNGSATPLYGNDSLSGGSGNDSIHGENDNNTIDGGTGDDTIDGADGKNVFYGGLGYDSIHGGDGGNTISGDDGDDTIATANGNDSLDGGEGSDSFNGGDGFNTIIGDSGNDTIRAGSGGNLVYGGDGADDIECADGNDLLDGGVGADTLSGRGGNDTLNGGLDNDVLSGGDGNDTYIVDNAGDVVSETGTGNDTVKTTLAAYTLGSNLENLIYTGAAGFAGTGNALDNAISGGIGNDTLNGGSANDTLAGGAEDDVIDGGDNTDTAIFSHDWVDYTITGAGPFTITDNSGSAPDGTDTVSNVENFQFANGLFSAAVIANDAPTDIVLSAASVSENATNGTVVGSLSSLDSDSGLGDTASYSLLADAGGRFGISGTDLVVANGSLLDYETNTSHAVTVRITDAHGAYFDEEFTIAVSDLNDNAPVFTSSATPSVAENTTAVVDLTAFDADTVGGPVTFAITGGADAGLFQIVGGNQLEFISARDYETQPHSYAVQVTASDGTLTTLQNLTVAVSDLNEAPTAINMTTTAAYTEGAASVTLSDIVVSDVDAGDTITAVLTLANTATGALSGGGGTYTPGTGVWTFTGTVAALNAALAAVVFNPVPGNDLDTTITTQIYDAANTGPAIGAITLDVTPAAPVLDLTELTAAQGFIVQGDAAIDQAGWNVSTAGDVNNDGFDDLIVGARLGDHGGRDAGDAYVVFGKSSGFGITVGSRQVIDLTNFSAADGFVVQGDAAGDLAGRGISCAGDVNGDGFDDLIVGAPRGNDGGTWAGEAYVVFGKSGGFGTAVGSRQVIDLTSLSASDGFVVQGDAAGDYAGDSASSAGDVNGDGFDDFIVGALFGDDGGTNAGEAYVVFGKNSGFGTAVGGRQVIDLTSLSAAEGFIIQGDAAGDSAGYSVSSARDVNGDGFDDLIVGARYGDDGGTNAGEAYVVFGTSSGFGTAVGGRQVIDLTSLSAAQGFIVQGDSVGDLAGFSVSSAGDVNGDGFDDLIVGAPKGDDGGGDAGEAYVVFGKSSGFGTTVGVRQVIDLTSLSATAGFVIQGHAADDRAGFSVSTAGDVNGDGFADLIVGAPYGDGGGTDAGAAYVVFGKSGGFGAAVGGRQVIDLTNLSVADGFIVRGDTAGDSAGIGVSSAGDVNSDGFDDLIVGAPFGDDGGNNAGEAYVVFGRMPDLAVNLTGTDASQVLAGGNFNDTLSALAGDDTLFGHAGNDCLDGGDGTDTAVFFAAWKDSTVIGTGPFTISGPDGSDSIYGVEYFQFSNGVFSAADIPNDTPTAIGLSAATIAENAANATVVGVLSSTDADSNVVGLGETATYSLTNSAGGRFDIFGTHLVVANGGLLDYETNTSHSVTVRITDAHGAYYDEEFTIAVIDLNDVAPVFTSSATPSVEENTTAVVDLAASDADTVGGPVTFAISGGADAGLFQIVGGNHLEFIAARDYETQPHSYAVQVTASDGTLTSLQNLTIALTDVPSAIINGTSGDDLVDQTHTIAGQPLPTDEGDTINGQAGNDTIDGRGGSDSIDGGFGNDLLQGGSGNDSIYGGGGLDTAGGNDVIYGEDGDDYLSGGSLADTIDGGAGNDTIDAVTGSDSLYGGSGNDFVTGGSGDNAIDGGEGNDTITCADGNDTARGGSGNDSIAGENGADTLYGDAGADTISGGTLSDIFKYTAVPDSAPGAGNFDTIVDFSHAQADKVDLAAIDADTTAALDQAFAFTGTTPGAHAVWYALGGGNTIVYADVDGDTTPELEIHMTGTIALVGGDFIL